MQLFGFLLLDFQFIFEQIITYLKYSDFVFEESKAFLSNKTAILNIKHWSRNLCKFKKKLKPELQVFIYTYAIAVCLCNHHPAGSL